MYEWDEMWDEIEPEDDRYYFTDKKLDDFAIDYIDKHYDECIGLIIEHFGWEVSVEDFEKAQMGYANRWYITSKWREVTAEKIAYSILDNFLEEKGEIEDYGVGTIGGALENMLIDISEIYEKQEAGK